MKHIVTVCVLLIIGFSSDSSAIKKDLHISFESPLLAQKGETQITHLDFDARMQEIPERDRAGFLSDPARIEEIINQLLLVQTMADRAFSKELINDPLVQADLYRTVSTRLSEMYREKLLEEQELDDYTNLAREIYILNPDRFEREQHISFSHILINANNPEAEKIAKQALDRIESGESLETIAAEISDDPSVRQNNGTIDAVPVSRLEERFRSGVSHMEVDETSLVQSGFGWHVVRLNEREPSRMLEFEEVREELLSQAKEQHHAEIIERMMRAHYAQDLEIAEGAVAELLDRYSVSSLQSD